MTYSSNVAVKEDLVERVFAKAGADDPEVDYRGEVAERTVALGGLVNVTYQTRRTDQITLSTVYNRRTEDASRSLDGFNLDSNTDQLNTRLQYIAQALTNVQLRGEHALGFLGGARVDWRGAYTRATRYEPNTREVLYRKFDGRFLWDDFVQSGSIFHQDLVDDGFNGGLTVDVPFRFRDAPAAFKLGASADRKDRDVFTRRFRFRPAGTIGAGVRALAPNDIFSEALIGPDGFEIQEATFRTDNYDAERNVDAAFGVLDFEPLDRVRVSGGVRVERTDETVLPKDLWDVGLPPIEGADLNSTDLLPALNVTFAAREDVNVRLGVSRTLARPELRELAPFSFADFAGGYLALGNPRLDLTRIRNLDLRVEWFAGPGSVLSVSGFHKRFDDPIEVAVLPSSELIRTWINADGATNYGMELEMRSDLGRFVRALSGVSFNGNLTLVESNVSTGGVADLFVPGTGTVDLEVVDRDRSLQGQSPYVVNVGLTWAPPASDASASILFNRFGRRIDAVGGQATPDVYEEARSQLDAAVEWPLRSGWNLKVSASRLLGSEVEFTQGGGLLRSWDLGRTLSFTVSWGGGR